VSDHPTAPRGAVVSDDFEAATLPTIRTALIE
jgi:hypothetical protein